MNPLSKDINRNIWVVYKSFIVIFSLSYIEGNILYIALNFWTGSFNFFSIENIDSDEKAAIDRNEYANNESMIWRLSNFLSNKLKLYVLKLFNRKKLVVIVIIKK